MGLILFIQVTFFLNKIFLFLRILNCNRGYSTCAIYICLLKHQMIRVKRMGIKIPTYLSEMFVFHMEFLMKALCL
jgi:hypothetical protein